MTDILARFRDVRPAGDGWTARCPAHDDKRSSLSIGRGTKQPWVFNCHAQCSLDAILQAAGLTMADVSESAAKSTGNRKIVQTYDYADETGTLLYQVVRFTPKDFRQRRPDGHGGWIWSLKGVRRVLYRLPQLAGCKTIFVTEGEQDSARLWDLGLPSTTSVGGAGKWHDEYGGQVKAAGCKHVVVLPDNDPPGTAHGRDVARSCAAAGLAVKLIPLPDLPPKGDISDWLNAGHTKDELLAIVQSAPMFDSTRPVSAAQPIELTSLADLLSEADAQVEYLVEDRIPAGSVVLFVAPPKVGKSTAARALALAVARREPWLGWKTSFGSVWLLVFEDKRSAVKAHFRRMGATGTEPIRLFIDEAPADLMPKLQALAEQERPDLIIVDTLARLIRAKDFNDYAEITQRFEPLLKLSRSTGATLLLLHHGSAHAHRDGLDAVLGSTAISGSVDNILLLRRDGQARIMSSVQRIGPDLEPTIITLDSESGRLERLGTKRDADDRELGERMLDALRAEPEPITEAQLQTRVEGRRVDQIRVLRRLLGIGQVERCGTGGRGNPYRYAVAGNLGNVGNLIRIDSRSRDSARSAAGADHPGTRIAPINAGLFDHSAIQVPEVPSIYREPETKDPVLRTQSPDLTSVEAIHVPEVPKVPTGSKSETFSPAECSENPRKQDSDSGSRLQVHDGRF